MLVHPGGQSFCHLVSIIVEVFAVERLADVDPDLAAVEAVQRMGLLGRSGPDLVSACDVDGDHGNAGLDRKVGCAVLHLGELAGVGSCAFREDEADIAFLDFLLGLDKSSYGVAVAVDCDTSADTHDEAAETAVVGLKVGSCEAAHPLEVALGEIVYDEYAVRITLVVGCYDVRIVLGEILTADTLHITEDMSQEQEAVLGHYVPEASFGRVLLVQVLMVVSTGHGGLAGLIDLLFCFYFIIFRHKYSKTVTVLITHLLYSKKANWRIIVKYFQSMLYFQLRLTFSFS